jgi:hypothetical protein
MIEPMTSPSTGRYERLPDVAGAGLDSLPRQVAEAMVDVADELGVDPRGLYLASSAATAHVLHPVALACQVDDELAAALGDVVAAAVIHQAPKERAAMTEPQPDHDPTQPPPGEPYLAAYVEVGDTSWEPARRRYRASQREVRRALQRAEVTVPMRRTHGDLLTTELVSKEETE